MIETVTITLLSLALMILTITQVAKNLLGLELPFPEGLSELMLTRKKRQRRTTIMLLSVTVGIVCAVGTITSNPMPNYPPVPVQIVMGIIAGLMASGGWDVVKRIQERGAELRSALPAPAPPVVVQPQVTVQQPAPEPVNGAPIEVLAPKLLADVRVPVAQQLPATMNILPD